ncbi:MAG: FHA domain-containing protein [Phycisphaerae bacterium]|jgi:pSer/pThr/pTyr-binding forkhead associated (FHA) protein|nr:FHA domain-containing protein [Phycisphaerae bacterium]
MDVNLVMFKSDGQRKDFPLVNAVSVIGRGEECELQIPLLNVSRRHCELRLDGDTIRVKDLASSNGTYLNNQRISEGELAAGDRLAIGPIVFTVQVGGQPEEVSPVKSGGQMVAEDGATDSQTVISEDIDIEVEVEPEVEPVVATEVVSAPTAVVPPVEAVEVEVVETVEVVEAAEVVAPPPPPPPPATPAPPVPIAEDEVVAALEIVEPAESDTSEPLDPISALEALAAESRKKNK